MESGDPVPRFIEGLPFKLQVAPVFDTKSKSNQPIRVDYTMQVPVLDNQGTGQGALALQICFTPDEMDKLLRQWHPRLY